MMQLIHRFRFQIVFMALFALSVVPTFAQDNPTIDIDMTSLFDQINYWASVLFPVLSIGFAIMIAIAIIRFVGQSIVSAFKGG